MRDGFHLAFIQAESRFEQRLAIAGGAGARDSGPGRHERSQLAQCTLGRLDGTALVPGVEGVKQLALHADEGHFGGGRSRVDAQEALSAIGGQIAPADGGALMPLKKITVFLMIGE